MARLDVAIVERGLTSSRQRAKRLIQNGQIAVNGVICIKPSFAVQQTDVVELMGSDMPFVGRGGLKLEHALSCSHVSLDGLICMDVGASTGGFTDCMLQHGAAKVYAIDVGHDQLAPMLRADARVICLEGIDIRQVKPDQFSILPQFFSVDVSFISLHHVLPIATALLQSEGQAVVLIKPQFEAGREHIGKNGVVVSKTVHQQILTQMLALFSAMDLSLQHLCPSPILGGSGNIEYLAVLQKHVKFCSVPDINQIVEHAFLMKEKRK